MKGYLIQYVVKSRQVCVGHVDYSSGPDNEKPVCIKLSCTLINKKPVKFNKLGCIHVLTHIQHTHIIYYNNS